MPSADFLQGFIFDKDKVREQFPDQDPMRCMHIILGMPPRELYRYVSAADVDDKLTAIIVLNAGDEEFLWQTLKIPDDDDFRHAVHHFMIPGVWRTHE